jgi:hypothetical protein
MPRDLTIPPRTAQQNTRAAVVTIDDVSHAMDTARRRCTPMYQQLLNATEIAIADMGDTNQPNQPNQQTGA